jgi:hypothetical protein
MPKEKILSYSYLFPHSHKKRVVYVGRGGSCTGGFIHLRFGNSLGLTPSGGTPTGELTHLYKHLPYNIGA